MSGKREISEYKGEALISLRNAAVVVGDRVRIKRNGEVYEGILIPCSEYSDEKHVVLKLKSGYNIGIRVTSDTKIKKIGKGTKPVFNPPPFPEKNLDLPKVAIISTGGTISSRVDYRTGAVRPALTASDLYSVVPELADIARIDTQILFSIFSENLTSKHWKEVAETVSKKIYQGVDGVVIAHGTDTMGYTAAALSFALQNLPVPVVLTGSQRSADRPSSDAATNLIGAVKAAVEAPFAEVVIAMHETTSDGSIAINRGTKIRKCHTSRRDAFKPINASQIARVKDEKVIMLIDGYRKRDTSNMLILKAEFDEKVALVKFYPTMSPKIIAWYIKEGYKGLILEGTGLGHMSKQCFKIIQYAIENNILVAMTSQCLWGRVNMKVYDSGRDLLSLGVIPLEDMLPETAVIKLMWVFGQTRDLEEAEKLLKENLVGEFSIRTLPTKIGFE